MALFRLFNGILQHGSAPQGWKKTLFTMLPKKTRAKLVTDFCLIANIRFFYKAFAYMILARVKQSLESFQAKSQHGFWPGRGMEEQQNLFWARAKQLDCHCGSSARIYQVFDTVNWEPLWEALHRQEYFRPVELPLSQSKKCRSRWCW